MNEIRQENEIIEKRAGSSCWDGAHGTGIGRLATDMSVDVGTRVDFKINVSGGAGNDCKVKIFRPGFSVGEDALICVAAVVLHDVPAGLVAVGNPASLLERPGARNTAAGEMRHSHAARHCAGTLLQE